MAEKLVSPGVFTKENDLSFLQQGVSEIGAAFVGPFLEGPLVPTIVNSQSDLETWFGKADGTYYTPLAAQNYLREAGTATICRVAGVGGYTAAAPLLLKGEINGVSSSVGVIFPTSTSPFTTSSAIYTNISESVVNLKDVVGTYGTNPLGQSAGYVYGYFEKTNIALSASLSPSSVTQSVVVLGAQSFSGSYGTGDACEALTPMIQSQLISGERADLFQFETIGAGNAANTKVKIGITNIKAAGSVNGSDYGSFTIVVRDFNDTNKKRSVLETFANVNLDPNSPNFISRVIGDRKLSIANDGKITENGDWVNQSKYVRVSGLNEVAPVQAVPFGHAAYKLPINAGVNADLVPVVTFVEASTTQFGGIDLDINGDNKIYMKPIPNNAGNGANEPFGLDDNGGEYSVGDAGTQFVVAFQEGFDGMSPLTPINKGADITQGNSQGFDLTNVTSKGSIAYMKMINALSNADEWDINMVVAPGVVKNQHLYIHTAIVDMVEQRADAFFITEMTEAGVGISTNLTQAEGLDTNYAATYYPWIKTIDVNTNKLITVPPSVLLPAVFAANDRVAAEWFAPAGLNRGGLVGAVSVLDRLTQSDRDTLYDGKVNPIAQFPGQGIVVFGQKTLQDKPSALDRINVRRLLLTVRKYIASTSRFLVFEQNTSTTRNRFLNIVNPYLESIQQRQGLYAFRVVMDETNNTSDVIDRNIMKGAIFLQPTKTAEFIQIDFNILPTGAAFNG
jgi:hypothetical protein